MPSHHVMKAMRRLGGIGSDISLPQAVQIVTAAFEQGVDMPRSAILDVGHYILDPMAPIDRRTRLKAAQAVAAFRERETIRRAVHVIGSNDTPLAVVQAAAVLLLGPPSPQLSRKTVSALQRCVRRYGQIRGPITDLVLLAARSGELLSKGGK